MDTKPLFVFGGDSASDNNSLDPVQTYNDFDHNFDTTNSDLWGQSGFSNRQGLYRPFSNTNFFN